MKRLSITDGGDRGRAVNAQGLCMIGRSDEDLIF